MVDVQGGLADQLPRTVGLSLQQGQLSAKMHLAAFKGHAWMVQWPWSHKGAMMELSQPWHASTALES